MQPDLAEPWRGFLTELDASVWIDIIEETRHLRE
jgi:hypothetical protein